MPYKYQAFDEKMELAGLPICDLDPYYEDKKTFLVISSGKVYSIFFSPLLDLLFPIFFQIYINA